MPVILPIVPSVPHQEFSTAKYYVELEWNDRGKKWYMKIFDENLSLIRAGIAVTLGAFLGRRCVDPRFPPGMIIASDTSGRGIEPTLDDIGTRVIVAFYSGPEILAAAEAEPGEASE